MSNKTKINQTVWEIWFTASLILSLITWGIGLTDLIIGYFWIWAIILVLVVGNFVMSLYVGNNCESYDEDWEDEDWEDMYDE